MHDVLSWEQCTYKFITNDNIIKNIKSLGDHNIEAMLMECMRRIDEFPQLLALVPNDHIIVSRTKRDGDDDSENMTGNERVIFGLSGPEVKVRDLIAKAKMTLFEVYEALKLLKDKGLIRLQDTHLKASDDTSTQAASKKAARLRFNILPLFFALVVFSLASFVGGHSFKNNLETHKNYLVEPRAENSLASPAYTLH
jgi:hypothetical protein